jgi:hypothetical protein
VVAISRAIATARAWTSVVRRLWAREAEYRVLGCAADAPTKGGDPTNARLATAERRADLLDAPCRRVLPDAASTGTVATPTKPANANAPIQRNGLPFTCGSSAYLEISVESVREFYGR